MKRAYRYAVHHLGLVIAAVFAAFVGTVVVAQVAVSGAGGGGGGGGLLGSVTVTGPDASGANTTGSPVLVGVSDGTKTYSMRGNADGSPVVASRSSMSPQAPTIVSVSNVSASVSPLPAGGCVRVTCGPTVYFRTGVAPLSAVAATDAPFFATQPEKVVCLATTETAMAFITPAASGTCQVSILNTP